MNKENKLTLPNGIDVFFDAEKGSEGDMRVAALAQGFLEHAEVMKNYEQDVKFHLLVYDDLLALGVNFSKGPTQIGFVPFSDLMLANYINVAMSVWRTPIRVIEKTTEQGKMFERIKKWTDMDWIAYDPITDILGEVKGRSCAARQYLESMPVNNELFAISQYHDKVKVVHMYIDEEFVAVGSAGEIKEGLMSRGKERQEYDAPIEEVEAMVRHKNPDALVVIEPLSFCSTNEVQSWSCLGCIFEEVYADKMGYNMEKADRSQMNISDLL